VCKFTKIYNISNVHLCEFVKLTFWYTIRRVSYMRQRGRRSRDPMVGGFTPTYAIGAYYH